MDNSSCDANSSVIDAEIMKHEIIILKDVSHNLVFEVNYIIMWRLQRIKMEQKYVHEQPEILHLINIYVTLASVDRGCDLSSN